MSNRKLLHASIFASLLVGAVVLLANRGPQSVEPSVAPAWELRDLEGQVVKSSDFDGKVVVLNFWATWCPPCRIEIPGFTDVQEEFREKGLVIVGVSLDEAPPEAVAEFSRQMEINYPVVMGDASIVHAYGGITALPTTFFIDRDGMIRNVHRGYLDKNAFKRTIEPLL
jgi:peroxiredoxin